jgi:hypothetical protein
MKKDNIAKFASYEQKNITPFEYRGLQEAFDFFNAELFEGRLPDCLITYQRKANSAGYFAPERRLMFTPPPQIANASRPTQQGGGSIML